MRKLKPISLVSLLLVAALVPALGAGPVAAQDSTDSTGEEWSSPSLPVNTTVDVEEGEQIHVDAEGASDTLDVAVKTDTGTTVASGTISSTNGSVSLDAGTGTGLTVEVSSTATSPTVDNLSVSVGVPTPDGETWEYPSLPVNTTVTTNETEEVKLSAVNASNNLTVSLDSLNGTEVANGTLVSEDDVLWLDPDTNGTWVVTVEDATTATGVSVDNLSVSVETNSPSGGAGGDGLLDGVDSSDPTTLGAVAVVLVALLALGWLRGDL